MVQGHRLHENARQKMHFLRESVTESLVVPTPLSTTWSVACNPRMLASAVPMLGRFQGPASLREGVQISEIHTILGWPQKYSGSITAFDEGSVWAMTSSPATVGPASLPHDVEYSFHQVRSGTRVTIRCDYTRWGVLRLPLGRQVVRWFMSRTLRKLLLTISRNAQICSSSYVHA